ncbi:hypothetical protein [Nocardia sp. NPDC024068]|uniref:hypothetical protein n=1 Tax=Nocardia sp. NPDC024068 TaxID=3157197 RepID=UPI003405F1D7
MTSSGEFVVTCSFPDVDLSTADELCADLSDSLRRAVPEVSTARVRDNEFNQDLGTILTIVLSQPAVVLLVRELFKWGARRYDASVRLSRSDTGETVHIKGPLTDRHERILRDFLSGNDHA